MERGDDNEHYLSDKIYTYTDRRTHAYIHTDTLYRVRL